MIVATLITYFCFLYFYLYHNDRLALTAMLGACLPVLAELIEKPALAWTVLLASLLPWWYVQGFEVGMAAWLVALSLVALPVVLLYPHASERLLVWSKKLLWVLGILLIFGELGAAYVE